MLFVFAGAKLQLGALWPFGLVIVSLVTVRTAVKILMLWLAGTVQRQSARASAATGMLLVPMAGLAIGLAQTSSGLSSEHAAVISAVVLGAVTLFETIGPPLAAFAFRFAGEAGQAHEEQPIAPASLSQPDSWSAPGPVVQMHWRGNVSGSADTQAADVAAIITDTDVIAGASINAVSPASKTTKLSRLFKWRRSGV